MQIILNPQLLWGHHILSAKLGHISTIKVWAVSNKHNAIVELLLDCPDIEVNCQDRMGNTPLHAAVEVS